jgi:hypothetical protein
VVICAAVQRLAHMCAAIALAFPKRNHCVAFFPLSFPDLLPS